MKPILTRWACLLGALFLVVVPARAAVRINELGASSSDRLLTRNENGIAHLGGGVQWFEPGFDASAWQSGTTPVGFGYGDIATNVSSLVQRATPTLYVRQEFEVSAAQAVSAATLSLRIDFDDGFIAYLNGVEVGRGNAAAPGAYLYADQVAYQGNSANGTGIALLLGPSNQLLREGTNVLAVEVHNESLDSPNLKLKAALSAGTGTLLGSGEPCRWFPGLISPSGGVFDPSLVFNAAGVPVNPPPAPEFEDWIELYNEGPDDADLSGWGLSDSGSDPLKWTFPEGTTLAVGEYLLVLADDREELNGFTTYLHTSYNLSAAGEALTLADPSGVIQSEIPGGYPPQYPTHSYGWDAGGGSFGYFAVPTPGAPNAGPVLSDRVDAPDFDVKGGFHSTTVTLTLTSSTPGAAIRYTMDGTEPTETHGAAYSAPLTLTPAGLSAGRVVRARAFKSGLIPSKSKSHTYLIGQSPLIRSVPALIFTGDEEEVFYRPHGVMTIEGGTYVSSLWQPAGLASYNIPINRGIQYERPVHLEFYHANGTPGFREDAGIRLAASSYSRPRLRLDNRASSPWPSDANQKPSFNLYFRNDYGAGQLDYAWLGDGYPVTSFEQLRIRAGKNDIRNPWIRDELMRRLYHDMGQASSLGITNTLYINGSFKGFFNMTERLREPFMRSHHGGTEEWDVRQVSDYAQGDDAMWSRMMSILSRNLNSIATWRAAETFLDPVNMADYFLLNIYGATWDWPQNNWVGARERSADGRYRLYVWDAEGAFGHAGRKPESHDVIGADLLGLSNPLSDLFKRLITSPEWRLIVADRINKHFFHGGVLDDRNAAGSRIRFRTVQLQREFQGILRHVHGEAVDISFFSTWTSPVSGRRTFLLGPRRFEFASHGLWPAVAPPEYNQHGGEVPGGFEVTISTDADATIHYTLDGSDPRLPGGAVAPDAATYEDPVALGGSRVVVKSRAYQAASQTWSALTEAEFTSGLVTPDTGSLVISELMYHPADASVSEAAAGFTNQDDFEFIELMNTGTAELDLAQLYFSAGITFQFSGSNVTTLAPGARVLVVSNLAAFRERYGTALDHRIAGVFSGALSNSGETVTLSLPGPPPVEIHSISYHDGSPWPDCADGPGHSLLLDSPGSAPDLSDPANWMCSPHFGGELGGNGLRFDYPRWVEFTFNAADAANPAISGEYQDPDSDTLNNFAEYALGFLPLLHDAPEKHPTVRTAASNGKEHLVLEFRRPRFLLPVTYTPQTTLDLSNWSNVDPAQIEAAPPLPQPDGTILESWRLLEPAGSTPARFLRLFMEQDAP